MPEKIEAWRSNDGMIHTTYAGAVTRDLLLLLSRIGDNEVCARKIVEALASDSRLASEVAVMVNELVPSEA